MKNISLKSCFYGILAGVILSGWDTPFLEKMFKNNPEEISEKNILVLDDFADFEKQIYINDDDTFDITHGELVSKIIENGLPDYKVDKVEAFIGCNSDSFQKHKQFDNILNGKKKYKAANVSLGCDISYDELSARTGIDVTPDNIASKAKEVKAYLKEHPDEYLKEGTIFMDATMGGVADFIDGLDSLSAKGTKIYVSTCNKGPNRLNLVSLVDGSVTVGAVDDYGTTYYSSENSLVRRHDNGTVNITKTKDGYSIDGGRTTAFKNTQVSKGSNKPYPYTHEGASLATPRVLVMDLKIQR